MKGKLKEFFELNPTQNANKHKDFINYIDTASVENGVLTNIEFLSCNFPSRAQRIVKYDDILYSTVRPNLRHYYHYRKNYDHLVASTGFVLIRNKNAENYSTRFLFYYLSSNSVVKHLSNIAELSQSIFPSFSPKDLGKIDLPELTIEKQTKIASILSAYDDLIENNNKRIKILEQMAENLYKEWFVRFRFPGYETAEFENGIPKEWNRDKIHTYYNTCSGGTPNRGNEEYFENGVYPWVKTGEIKDCVIIDTEEYITQEAVKKSSAKILPSKSLAMAMYGVNIGLLAYLDAGFTCNQACCVFVDKRNFSSINYLYQYLKSIREYLLSISFGAAQQNISQEIIRKIKIIMPSNEIITAFEKQIDNIYGEIRILLVKNKNLTVQRDSLLPRLMSGKLEV